MAKRREPVEIHVSSSLAATAERDKAAVRALSLALAGLAGGSDRSTDEEG